MTTPATPNPISGIQEVLTKFAPFDGQLLDYAINYLVAKKPSVMALVDTTITGIANQGADAIEKQFNSEGGILGMVAKPLAGEIGNVIAAVEKTGETALSDAYDKAISYLQVEAKILGG